MNLFQDLKFNSDYETPIYLQIANSVTYNISRGNIKKDEKLPSINAFSKEYKVSRDTVEKAYRVLKDKNIIVSRLGKGFYISRTNLILKKNILFLINRLSPYKLKIYNSFIKTLKSDYHIDFEVYHCDESLFLSLMEKNKNRYDYYVIMPHFKFTRPNQINIKKESIKAINSIPTEKLIIMDNNELSIDGDIIEIYQDFENDIYNALKSGINKIKKYKILNLVLTKGETYPHHKRICRGFKKFCNEKLFNFKILNKIEEDKIINSGDLFLVITDDDLVKLLDLITTKNLILGKDVGVISYDETPFKRLLDIAVISTNFKKMGETAANMIMNNKKGKIKNPFLLVDRKSI